jgi:hypothetical protein
VTPGPFARIAAARARGYVLFLTLYCESSPCPARTIELAVKDHDSELLTLARTLRCPLCGRDFLSLHKARTLREYEKEQRLSARGLVALDMWLRDQPLSDRERAVAFPASILSDTRLPPTPPEWWERKEDE